MNKLLDPLNQFPNPVVFDLLQGGESNHEHLEIERCQPTSDSLMTLEIALMPSLRPSTGIPLERLSKVSMGGKAGSRLTGSPWLVDQRHLETWSSLVSELEIRVSNVTRTCDSIRSVNF